MFYVDLNEALFYQNDKKYFWTDKFEELNKFYSLLSSFNIR